MLSSSYYASQIREANEELQKLKRNQKELLTMIFAIEHSLEGEIEQIHMNIETLIENGHSAMQQDSIVTKNIDNIKNAEEKNTLIDKLLSQARSDVQKELSSVSNKISRCEEKIRSLTYTYEQALAEEEAERERQEEELRRAEEKAAKTGKTFAY